MKIPTDVQETFDRMTTAVREFEAPEFKLPEFKLPEFEAPEFKLPEFDMPEFKLPEFDLPKFDMPRFDMPSTERMVDVARDAAYVGVGVAVVTAQKADERRREMTDAVADGVRRVVDAVA